MEKTIFTYWEKSIKNHLEKHKRDWEEKRNNLKENMKETKIKTKKKRTTKKN